MKNNTRLRESWTEDSRTQTDTCHKRLDNTPLDSVNLAENMVCT